MKTNSPAPFALAVVVLLLLAVACSSSSHHSQPISSSEPPAGTPTPFVSSTPKPRQTVDYESGASSRQTHAPESADEPSDESEMSAGDEIFGAHTEGEAPPSHRAAKAPMHSPSSSAACQDWRRRYQTAIANLGQAFAKHSWQDQNYWGAELNKLNAEIQRYQYCGRPSVGSGYADTNACARAREDYNQCVARRADMPASARIGMDCDSFLRLCQ